MKEKQAKIKISSCLNKILYSYFRRIMGPSEQNSAKKNQEQFQNVGDYK